MAKAARQPSAPLVLVWGDDDFPVKQRSEAIYNQWRAELGGSDHEIIDAASGNAGEALKALARLREALQTLPFFGTGKALWFRNCTFLADDRTASSQAVTGALAELVQELKTFPWDSVRLLISAVKVDKRKAFYKLIEKSGAVEHCAGLSIEDRDWEGQAASAARGRFRELGKEASADAVSALAVSVGPNLRQILEEVEKVILFTGDRPEVTLGDVEAITTRNKHARAFALGDALGDRDLARLLQCLDEELWNAKTDPQKTVIGLLYGLISKVRVLILLQALIKRGWVKPGGDFSRFKAQLDRIPADALPEDRRYNPLALNPYVLFKALGQAQNYSETELVEAMESLLACNQQLISSSQDDTLILQRTLVRIAAPEGFAS